MPRLVVFQSSQRSGGGGGAERGTEAVGRVAVLAKFIGVERHVEARGNVVTERNRPQETRAVAALALTHGERGRDDGAAGVAQ